LIDQALDTAIFGHSHRHHVLGCGIERPCSFIGFFSEGFSTGSMRRTSGTSNRWILYATFLWNHSSLDKTVNTGFKSIEM
jgi:hypothetical protein